MSNFTKKTSFRPEINIMYQTRILVVNRHFPFGNDWQLSIEVVKDCHNNVRRRVTIWLKKLRYQR